VPVRIDVQPTPNIHALKFALDRAITQGRSQTFMTAEQAAASPLAQALFAVPGVKMVFFLNDFVTVTREPDADWNVLAPEVERILRAHFETT